MHGRARLVLGFDHTWLHLRKSPGRLFAGFGVDFGCHVAVGKAWAPAPTAVPTSTWFVRGTVPT